MLMLLLPVWAQGPPSGKAAADAIQRAKTVLISSLDDSLPRVTLEFFLQYEGQGATIHWEVNDCGKPNRDAMRDRARDRAMCVKAEVDLKDGRATIVVVSVGTLKTGSVGVPTLEEVKVTDAGRAIHRLNRLSELPVELHRPLPKGPKDLPPPMNARLWVSAAMVVGY